MLEVPTEGPQLSDLNWYRAHYSLAVQCLQIATLEAEGEDRVESGWPGGISPTKSKWRKAFGPETQRLLLDLRNDLQSTGRDLHAPAATAEREAEELVRSTVEVLDEAGWHWVGRQPPRYLLWLKRRSLGRLRERPPGSDDELARFLNEVVEPSAVILTFSTRVVKEPKYYWEIMEGMLDHFSPSFQPLDRRKQASQGWLLDYLVGLTADGLVNSARHARFEARLGRTRFRAPKRLGFRVRYNLACLFSRLAKAARDDDNSTAEDMFAAIAATELERSLRGLPDDNRAPLSEWAEKDPGLDGLRTHGKEEFAAIIAKWRPRGRRRLEASFPESTVIRRIAYDPVRLALEVEFPDDSRFEYLGVPQQGYDSFETAQSPGEFFNSRIRERYPTIRLR
jgi:KTSC domain-containing protein